MDLQAFIGSLIAHEPIREADLMQLFEKAQDVLFQEATLVPISAPITICGDVHGQFSDVVHLFEVGGPPPHTRYLFLGDYVDRGYYSIETFALLLAYKLMYPDNFYLLRGNHECRQVNQMYGFYEECINRFGHAGPYKMCNDVFDLLPIAALVEESIYCVHGGLSPKVCAVEQVVLFERRQEIPNNGPISDMCWSDPEEKVEWGLNQRGAGYVFGPRPTEEFCRNNRLRKIVRAHQLATEGYVEHFGKDQLVTIWSAPRYMYRIDNKAAIMHVSSSLDVVFQQFEAVPGQDAQPDDDQVQSYFR